MSDDRFDKIADDIVAEFSWENRTARAQMMEKIAAAIRHEADSLSFSQLRQANDDRAKQWNSSGANVPLIFSLVELAGEAGEACNIGKKLARTELGLAGGTAELEPLEDEIADVVICADLVARKAGFDLGAAVARKFNATSRKRGFSVMLPQDGYTAVVGTSPTRPQNSEASSEKALTAGVVQR